MDIKTKNKIDYELNKDKIRLKYESNKEEKIRKVNNRNRRINDETSEGATRNRAKWTFRERMQLYNMKEAGMTDQMIAEKLKRTLRAIQKEKKSIYNDTSLIEDIQERNEMNRYKNLN